MSFKRTLKIALLSAVAVLLFTIPPGIYFSLRYYDSLQAEVIARFSGKRWDIPSRIYSDSTIVYPGQNLKDLGFFQRLARLNYHRVAPGAVNARGEYSYDEKTGKLEIFLHSFSYPYRNFSGELVRINLSANQVIQSIQDVGSGRAIYSTELEPELIGGIFQGNWKQRRIVRLSQVPPAFIDAILAAEDHRFYEHGGLDFLRIVKAAWVDLLSGHIREGGSTLTQQLMKNFFLTNKRTFSRKIKEALMALIAEHLYSKQQILELYVNDIYLGQRGQEGIYGIWEASQYYFSREPRDLTIAEMATIAGMISAPNRFNPLKHPKAATFRRNEVLHSMLEDGYISGPAYQQAVAEPLHARETFTESNDAPYFIDYVKSELATRYPPEVLTDEGLRIFTTLDVHTEKLAEAAVKRNLDDLESRYKLVRLREKKEPLEECLLALEPQSGKIRAMVGGRSYRISQFNRVTQSRRQPGSAFKIVTYAAAFQETLEGGPYQFLPTSYIDDAPFTWQYGNMQWTPKNYKDRYFGRVTLEFALEESLNTAAARIANAIGLDRVLAMAQKLGFGKLPPYPSIVLGGIEVTPLQLAQAYAIVANDGMKVQPYAITAVVDDKGHVIEGHEFKAEQVLSPQVAYMMQFMFQQVINHGTGSAARSMGFTRPAAGKTGTSNDDNDAWFVGFTPNLLAVVWTGFDQKEPLGLTGAQASLPAWTMFMKDATSWRPLVDFNVPPGLVKEKVDPLTGCKAPPDYPMTIEGVFPVNLAPTRICPPLTAPLPVNSADHSVPVAPNPVTDPND
jgi:penicillin-binding protein 1B